MALRRLNTKNLHKNQFCTNNGQLYLLYTQCLCHYQKFKLDKYANRQYDNEQVGARSLKSNVLRNENHPE